MPTVALNTYAALLEHHHNLAAYCPACRRWADVDLEGLVTRGLCHRSFVGHRPRCRHCGTVGELQVRPPLPKFTGATWMQ